jgi:threonine/homoserine/homoserine lactone efflux protein
MPAAHTLLAFALVAAVVVVVPGPSNLFVLTRGLQSGSRAAVAGAAGCATGALVYVVATAVGLAALLASSSVVFAIVHYAGAAYLCWLGIQALRARDLESPTANGPRSPWRSYRQGLVIELGNPKVALFFLALFPQFIDPGAGPAAVQVLILGAIFVSIGMTSDCLYAFGSGRLRALMTRRPKLRLRQERASGVLYLGLGGWAAVSGSGSDSH